MEENGNIDPPAGELAACTHWIGVWVGTRADPASLESRRVTCYCRQAIEPINLQVPGWQTETAEAGKNSETITRLQSPTHIDYLQCFSGYSTGNPVGTKSPCLLYRNMPMLLNQSKIWVSEGNIFLTGSEWYSAYSRYSRLLLVSTIGELVLWHIYPLRGSNSKIRSYTTAVA